MCTYRNVFAFVVRSSSESDADGSRHELSVKNNDHYFVGRSSGLFQGLVGLINQSLQLLKRKERFSIRS